MYNYCDGHATLLEIFLLFWILTLLAEEVRQIVETPTKERGNSWRYTILEFADKVKKYFAG